MLHIRPCPTYDSIFGVVERGAHLWKVHHCYFRPDVNFRPTTYHVGAGVILPTLGSKNMHSLYRLRNKNKTPLEGGLPFWPNTSMVILSSCQGGCLPVYQGLQLQKLWDLHFQRLAFNNCAGKRFGIYLTSKSLLGVGGGHLWDVKLQTRTISGLF